MFEQTKYDPSFFETVQANYAAGKSYQIKRWEWGEGSVKNITNIIECPTLEDFQRELWDLFAEFSKKETVNTVWGAPMGLVERNPFRPLNPYYDGLIFYLIRKEFMECIEHEEVSRFMSCLIHFGYFHLEFVVV